MIKPVIFNLKFIIDDLPRLSLLFTAKTSKFEWFQRWISHMSSYSFFVCVINIQFLPGIAAVITHRLGNSNGKHTAQQKVLVLRHKQAFSITLFRKSSRLCCKSPSFNKSYKCLSIFVRGEDHSWTYWEIISVTSLRQTRSPLPGVAH